MTLDPRLEAALRSAWSIDVTWTPESYEGRPTSTGQCGNVSFALWMLEGIPIHVGRHLREGRWEPHYWSQRNHERIDLTLDQFKGTSTTIQFARPLEHIDAMLHTEWLRRRAALHLHRVMAHIRANNGGTL